MAGLTNTTIAGSYERLLILPANGLNGTNLVAITDGDSDTACSLSVSTNKAKISGSLEITTSPLSFDGAATIDTSGNNLLTLQGATAGVRIDDFLGIDTAPNVNYGVKNLRTTTATGNAAGVIAQESVTLPSTANHYSSLWADAVITNVSSATAMAKVSAVRTGAFDVALASGSRTITNLAGVYVGGPPTTSGSGTTTVTNGPYSIFVDAGDCRFDGSVGIGTGSPVTNLHISEGTAGGETLGLTIENSDTSTSTDETVGLSFRHRGRIAGKIVSHRLDEYCNAGEASAGLKFYGVNSESYSLGMTIDHAGKVGIGTATPTGLLQIESSSNAYNYLSIRNTGGANTYAGIMFSHNATANREKAAFYALETKGEAHYQSDFVWALRGGGGDATQVSSSDEKMRLTSAGKVGIGTASPDKELHVYGGNDAGVHIQSSNGGSIKIAGEATGSSITAGSNQYIRFLYDAGATEAMRIIDGGNVGIGLTAPAHKLDVVGTAGLSTGTAWTNTSDSRVKTNIETISDGLDKINQLRPVSFNYTDDYLEQHPEIDSTKRYNSFIAQEYKEVFPDAVNVGNNLEKIITEGVEAKDAILGDDGNEISPVIEAVEEIKEVLVEDVLQFTPHDLNMYLVKAIQELSAKVEALENA